MTPSPNPFLSPVGRVCLPLPCPALPAFSPTFFLFFCYLSSRSAAVRTLQPCGDAWKQFDPGSGSSHQEEPQQRNVARFTQRTTPSRCCSYPFLEENTSSSYDAGSVGNAFRDEKGRGLKTKQARIEGGGMGGNGLVSNSLALSSLVAEKSQPVHVATPADSLFRYCSSS
ncbi:hypothetical protein LZ31DRAFT_86276 [Colletotrichum somersetense]|nr:hypothetical protein LZ31DRAFT_86276 [Colletotrichum somersetense]